MSNGEAFKQKNNGTEAVLLENLPGCQRNKDCKRLSGKTVVNVRDRTKMQVSGCLVCSIQGGGAGLLLRILNMHASFREVF